MWLKDFISMLKAQNLMPCSPDLPMHEITFSVADRPKLLSKVDALIISIF